MSKEYQDMTSLGMEEDAQTYVRQVPSSRFSSSELWRQRFCPTRRLILILLVLASVLSLTAIVFLGSGHTFGAQLSGIQELVKDINHTVAGKMVDLSGKGRDMESKLRVQEKELNLLVDRAETAKDRLLDQAKTLRSNLQAMHCKLESFEGGPSGKKGVCCPSGWASFHQSCYWESSARKSWHDAKDDCEDKGAHLVIINSYEEQLFVAQRVRPRYTWLGLTDASGTWKWLDGTPYTVRPQDWMPQQPDDFYGHGLGGGEDCAHFHRDGRWNDDHCSRLYSWACEMEMSA